MKKLLFILLPFFILTACATSATNISDAKPAPSDRIYQDDYVGSDSSELVFVRDSGLMGTACLAKIYIDGKEYAGLKSGEKVKFKVSPGEHIIGVTLRGGGLCAFSADLVERDVNVSAGDVRAYRAFVDQGGNPSLMPTTKFN